MKLISPKLMNPPHQKLRIFTISDEKIVFRTFAFEPTPDLIRGKKLAKPYRVKLLARSGSARLYRAANVEVLIMKAAKQRDYASMEQRTKAHMIVALLP